MHFKRGSPIVNQIDKIAIIGLIGSLAFACVGTIWAIYLESLLHNPSHVGLLISFFTIITLVSYLFVTPLIEKNSKTKLYFISLVLYFIALIFFTFLSQILAVIILGILISIIVSIRITTFGIIVSDKSNKKSLSRNEGLIYTFSDTAWLVGPLIAGFISARYGFKAVFLFAAIFIFMAIFLLKSFKISDNHINKKTNNSIFKLLKDFFKDTHKRMSYIISGGINFWWCLIYIYIPIFIIESGYTSRAVGYFLFAVVIPLILFTYIFGKLAGKIGFRKIFFMGYFIMGTLAIICFFLNNLIWILAILIFASIGASMIECTTEAYFFDIVKKDKDKYYGIYNTTIDVNYFLASFLGALLISIVSFKFLFIFFGVVMFLMALASLRIKNIIESRKK